MAEDTGPQPEEPTVSAAAGEQTGDTWDDLGRQLNELGSAIARAVQAAVDDPENKRRAVELRDELESMARTVGDALDEAASSPQGQRVKDEVGKAAESVAAASRKVADDVRPHLIEAARTASEKLREAAAGMERRADAAQQTVRDATAPTGDPSPEAPKEDPS